MIKIFPKLSIAILVASLGFNLHAQLSVSAGPDTILCESNFESYQLGDFVTIEGGKAPFEYSWSCTYEGYSRTYFASTYLNDTLSSHPIFISGFDTLDFELAVKDSDGFVAKDSVTIILSQFIYCLAECYDIIDEGDSSQLWHCVFGGIPPYSYSWDNDESLSNSFIPNPWANPGTSTSYMLTVIDAAGCISSSSCYVSVLTSGIADFPPSDDGISIYPNPIKQKGLLKIENSNQIECLLDIYDVNGRVILRTKLVEEHSTISLRELPIGIYYYRIGDGDGESKSGNIIIN